MKRRIGAALLVIGAAAVMVSAQGASSVVHGTIKKVDAAAKTVVVATDSGAEEVVHFTDKTVVHGTVAGAKDAFQGLKEGSEIVAHTSASGGRKTATEVDKLGKDGLKSAQGSVSKVDATGKKLVIKTADGLEQTFDLTEHAAANAGKATAKEADKASKATVYYTEEAGKKVVHFFKP